MTQHPPFTPDIIGDAERMGLIARGKRDPDEDLEKIEVGQQFENDFKHIFEQE